MAGPDGATATAASGGGEPGGSSPQRTNRRGGGAGGDSTSSGRGGGRGRGGRGRGGGGGGGGGGRGGGGRGGGGDAQHGGPSSRGEPGSGEAGHQRRRGGGRGRGHHHGGDRNTPAGDGTAADATTAADGAAAARLPTLKDALLRPPDSGGEDGADEDAEVCFICANPVIHHSIAPCNHLTCHICALRMRALYRTKDCPHCRTPAPYVIFTDDPSKRFDEYTDADITSTDENIGIKYTNEDIVGDTVLLLRYNCPDESCDYAGFGWPDLHRHVRAAHHKKMCDLCTRNKKVFTHEHELFTDKALEKHMRHGDDKPGAVDQTGFRGHPLCGFCGERFYDDDKLYEHCRNKHERCFICDRRDSRQPHYYRNYNELEKHFRKDHFLCADRECLEKKFVVFESELDLKAHQLSEHGSSLSKDVRRDVQVVSMADFDFRPAYHGERGGGGGGGGGGGSGGGRSHQGRPSRGRDPNADAPAAVNSAQSMRRDEIAYQRQLAIHSAQSISNRTFGSHLSAPAPTPAQAHAQAQAQASNSAPRQNGRSSPAAAAAAAGGASRSAAPSSADQTLADPMAALDLAHVSPQERARLVRHGAVIERASNLLGSNPAKVSAFRSNISSYRAGAWSAPQLIDAFSALFADTSDTALGSLVREVADLFDDAAKADALRRALHDRRAVHEDYPSLPTLGGMHGAATSTGGWATAAAASPTTAAFPSSSQRQSSTRVLRLKHSTRLGGSGPSASASSSPTTSTTGPAGRTVPGATWTSPSRPAASFTPTPIRPQTSSTSAAFPALPSAAGGKKATSTGASSSWAGVGGGSSAPASSLAARVGGGAGGSSSSAPGSGTSTPRRPVVGEDAFPALPAAPKPPMPSVFGYGRRAVRRDLGGNQETGFSWGGGSVSNEGASSAAGAAAPGDADDDGAGKGKKKGKQGKKVLVQWG